MHDDESGKSVDTEEVTISDNESNDESSSENEYREDAEESSSDAEESSDDDDAEDPWSIIIDLTFKKWQPEYSERVQRYMEEEGVTIDAARDRVFRDMRDKYRKTLTKTFANTILWCRALKEDSIYKAIKKTASDLELMDDYDSKEAWEYAISKRKYLFNKVLKAYEPPEITETAAAAAVQQGGAGRVLQKEADGPVQRVERWAESELKRIKNQPYISIIGRRY